jgi:hypothetical protein
MSSIHSDPMSSIHPSTPAPPASIPKSVLEQQKIENEEKAARHRRAAQSEDQRKV